jgi:Calcineurin-like phosphoesterase
MPKKISPGQDLQHKLRRGKLPQMVDWFDPLVLGMVGVRTLISTTIGEYADQRPMQEVVDGDKGDLLMRRHDYSVLDTNRPNTIFPPDVCPGNPCRNPRSDAAITEGFDAELASRRLALDNGALWVDFVADLGDGFEATYAMALLLAAEKLKVRGVAEELPAGQILIFGGDLAYPNATIEEYRNRCLQPYNCAFTIEPGSLPPRELFFIAGNHDWYDGLSAFSQQFCYESTVIGGWRCTQQRSYFSLKLPYDWHIWGVDVALGDSIDSGQIDYFKQAAERMDIHKNPKVVIILHAPDWTKTAYKALNRICELARQNAEICAIIAGDLHHYSHYISDDPRRSPPMHVIVSGGGGAFAHPTHDQRNKIEIEAPVVTRELLNVGHELLLEAPQKNYSFRAKTFYPSRPLSRLIALKNLWLPFHNRGFAALVGFVYFFYAWVFHTSAPPMVASGSVAPAADAAAVARAAEANPVFFFMLLGLWVGLVLYVDARLSNRFLKWLNGSVKVVLGSVHFLFHMMALLYVAAISTALTTKVFNPVIGTIVLYSKVFLGEFFDTGSGSVDRAQDCLAGIDWASPATWQCVTGQQDAFYIAATALSHAAISILIGGIIGAFIFGCYWVITSVLFGMHQDAFSALGIKDYKNFLRMKFEENKLTIYPIALHRVPGRRDWLPYDPDNSKGAPLKHRPLIVPKSDMKPHLIEDRISIDRHDLPPTAAIRDRGNKVGF